MKRSVRFEGDVTFKVTLFCVRVPLKTTLFLMKASVTINPSNVELMMIERLITESKMREKLIVESWTEELTIVELMTEELRTKDEFMVDVPKTEESSIVLAVDVV